MSEELEKVFDFNESDLLMNQDGKLSEKQFRLISQYRRMNRIFGWLALIVMFISISGISFIALYITGVNLQNNPEVFIAYALLLSVGMLIVIFFMLLGKLRSDLKSGKISIVEGFAGKKEKKIRRNFPRAYYMTVGRVRFQLDGREKYQSIEPNIHYRIFYIKHPPTHIILSVIEIPVRHYESVS
jgi:hypothetical protein